MARASEPSAFMIITSQFPSASIRRQMMREPSGDHEGYVSTSGVCVIRCTSDPSVRMEKRSMLSGASGVASRFEAKRIRSPSGDQTGCSSWNLLWDRLTGFDPSRSMP